MNFVTLLGILNTSILASSSEFNEIGNILKSFINEWWGPLLIVIGASGIILGAFAGFKFWFASGSGDENKLKAAKQFLIGILIGFVIIFVLAVLTPVIIAAFQSWAESNGVG